METKRPFGAVFATSELSPQIRRNPRLSELVRLGLWRICGASCGWSS
jgi:hypothetical protein